MSTQPPAPQSSSVEELPPVKPPTGAFILQLFLIPGAIVAAIFLVAGLFGLLADSNPDPYEYVRDLTHPTNEQRRWRSAHALANLLAADRRFPLGGRYTADAALAVHLAGTLDQMLEESSSVGGSDSKEDTQLRAFLATALGMFDDPAGAGPLLRAAQPDQPTEVRVRALQALIVLADRCDGDLGDPNIAPGLVVLAEDSEALVRKLCAYLMGVLGDPRFVGHPPERPGPLIQLLGDGNQDVSYNAALALARMGRPEAIETLDRMLEADPSRPEIVQEDIAEQHEFKTSAILLGALEAIQVLAQKNPEAHLDPLVPKVESLTHHRLQKIRLKAQEVLRLLSDRTKPFITNDR